MLFLVISTLLTEAGTVLFAPFSHHGLHKCQGKLWCGGLLLTPGIQESSRTAPGEKSPWGWEECSAELGGLTFSGDHLSEEERALASEVTAELY